jgi:ABC-2 type transport system ATP-binding protein
VKHIDEGYEKKDMEKAIAVELLNHRYGEQQALKDLSFEVQHGEVFGLLGPNGAGKTTTVRLLNGLFEATSGNISVLGFDPRREGEKIRSASGVLTETPLFMSV